MWKYRHIVKENPKSGYDWSATGQWQTVADVFLGHGVYIFISYYY